MSDEIIREAWRIKDEIAREHNYNVQSLVAALKESERLSGHTFVDLRAKKRAALQAPPPPEKP